MLLEEPSVSMYNPEFLRRARANNRRRQREREKAERQARIEMLAEEAAKAREEILAKKAATKAAAEAVGFDFTPITTLDRIIKRAVRLFGIPRARLLGNGRAKDIAFARQFVMYWARRKTRLSTPQIGRKLGGKDHTTVIHGCRAYVSKRAAMNRHLRPAR